MSQPHTRQVVSEVDITSLGDYVTRVIQTVKVTTANGRILECTWTPGAFEAAYVQGHIDMDELEALLADVLAHPRLERT